MDPRPPRRLLSSMLWIAAALITVACFLHQNRTGPTYPLEGEIPTAKGRAAFLFQRSEEIGHGLPLLFKDPVPPGLSASVRFRRFKSHDPWSEMPMQPGTFTLRRRGSEVEIQGLGLLLPSLQERAGKYEFLVLLEDGSGPSSVTGSKTIVARYKAPVPRWALLPHILVIFLSMTLALRTAFEALRGGPTRGLLWATVASLLLGAFLLGPTVQRYAFGVWWSGVPFGWDWTDNKVLVELAAWLLAAWLGRDPRRTRPSVLFAALVTLAIYFIPHSLFGSEFDYTRGQGRGSTGATAR